MDGEGSPPPLPCVPIFAVLRLRFTLCQQLLITPHWGVGHAWVSFGPPHAPLLLPNLSSSGDVRRE